VTNFGKAHIVGLGPTGSGVDGINRTYTGCLWGHVGPIPKPAIPAEVSPVEVFPPSQ